ncbi:MAG: substrate-binding domain-containing protein [Solirubrobacterales bacterium]
MSSRRPLALAIVVALLALLLGACGDLGNGGDETSGEVTEPTTERGGEPKPDLPPLPAGQVQIEGQLAGSLTEQVTDDFRADATNSGLAIDVTPTATDEASAFASLCAGEIDFVDTSRRITDEELKDCTDNGLEVVDFQISFDATVVVTRNERDVGADCVNFDQLRAMFGAGTPVTAWNQVNPNFFPIQLSTVGPDQDASDFTFFGQRVLGVAEPTLADFRSDYVPYGRDNAIKNAIVGGPDDPGGAAPGTVGFLGFSFYELYEDKLRPLEIDGQSGDRCVFPSEETISSELYPLERTLRLYTTQRSLNRQEVQAYLKYYLQRSEEISDDLELIPISDAVRRQEIARISDPLAYGETPNGETSEPDPEGVVATTSTQPEVGTPSGDGVDTTTTPEGSAPPTTSTSPTTTTTTTTTAP